ncbi:hypothetical protein APHAL10511_006508 [Amanita phalloides]|nr:hypothetical protein APHAL10511_006508 [Amanita phalloides]
MNSVASSLSLAQSSSRPPPIDTDFTRLFTSASSLLDQASLDPPPPSLREILSAYRSRGDGDREMLLAMLNAKAAEDQRLASIAALHRTALEIHQASLGEGSHPPPNPINGHPYISAPSSHPPHHSEQIDCRRQYLHRHIASRSHSPPRSHLQIPPIRDAPTCENAIDHPRKRPRTASSLHAGLHEQNDHLPPSPYSSSSRSDSAEYSPRSRASMAIGSLLSSGPKHTANDVHD